MLRPTEDYPSLDKNRIKVYFASSYGTLCKRKTGGYNLPAPKHQVSSDVKQKDLIQVVVPKHFGKKLMVDLCERHDTCRSDGHMKGSKNMFTSHNSFNLRKWTA